MNARFPFLQTADIRYPELDTQSDTWNRSHNRKSSILTGFLSGHDRGTLWVACRKTPKTDEGFCPCATLVVDGGNRGFQPPENPSNQNGELKYETKSHVIPVIALYQGTTLVVPIKPTE
jgi:hypothetical protein